jgi:putative transposase
MAFTQLIYHLIFSTKNRESVLINENRDQLFKYISGILNNKNCYLYCINGVEDHIHILTHIHQSISISDMVKDVKIASSKWIREKNIFPDFNGWQDKYGVFTYSLKEKETLIKYIENQEKHHKKESSKEEFIRILTENGVEFDMKYLY